MNPPAPSPLRAFGHRGEAAPPLERLASRWAGLPSSGSRSCRNRVAPSLARSAGPERSPATGADDWLAPCRPEEPSVWLPAWAGQLTPLPPWLWPAASAWTRRSRLGGGLGGFRLTPGAWRSWTWRSDLAALYRFARAVALPQAWRRASFSRKEEPRFCFRRRVLLPLLPCKCRALPPRGVLATLPLTIQCRRRERAREDSAIGSPPAEHGSRPRTAHSRGGICARATPPSAKVASWRSFR
jgi:hypothetical protein